MNNTTAKALVHINQRFYAHFATAFSASRSHPWPGWQRVLSHLEAPQEALQVLDVGCGNGRFGLSLHSAGHRCHYLGLDENPALLRDAKRSLASLDPPRLLEVELLTADLDTVLGGDRFHLIVLFGLLHHVPGESQRQRLLSTLARRLRPGGLLAATVWRADRQPGFERKVLPWERYNQECRERGEMPIDLSHLEPGDRLLTWSGDEDHPRYCHFPTDDEIEGWLKRMGLSSVDRFQADGKSGADNSYLVLRSR